MAFKTFSVNQSWKDIQKNGVRQVPRLYNELLECWDAASARQLASGGLMLIRDVRMFKIDDRFDFEFSGYKFYSINDKNIATAYPAPIASAQLDGRYQFLTGRHLYPDRHGVLTLYRAFIRGEYVQGQDYNECNTLRAVEEFNPTVVYDKPITWDMGLIMATMKLIKQEEY